MRDSEKEIFLGSQYDNIRLLKLTLLTNPIEVDEVGSFDSDQWVKPTVEFLTGFLRELTLASYSDNFHQLRVSQLSVCSLESSSMTS